MIRLTEERLLRLYSLMAERTGGSAGIRDKGLLDSALDGIFQSFSGKELYPSLKEKGARLGYSLISNHAFIDGNKRIGIFAMLVFLEVNGIRIGCTDDEIVEAGLGVASGTLGYEELLGWVLSHEGDQGA